MPHLLLAVLHAPVFWLILCTWTAISLLIHYRPSAVVRRMARRYAGVTIPKDVAITGYPVMFMPSKIDSNSVNEQSWTIFLFNRACSEPLPNSCWTIFFRLSDADQRLLERHLLVDQNWKTKWENQREETIKITDQASKNLTIELECDSSSSPMTRSRQIVTAANKATSRAGLDIMVRDGIAHLIPGLIGEKPVPALISSLTASCESIDDLDRINVLAKQAADAYLAQLENPQPAS
jgi:hypothetical protein